MKTINANQINVNDIFVATYNADAFNVADTNMYGAIAETLNAAGTVDVLTADDADFADWAARLDYTEELPEAIYVANGNELAFTLE